MNGPGAHLLYKYMRSLQPVSLPSSGARDPGEEGKIEWNYTKFLVNRQGVPVKRFKPAFDPADFESDVSPPQTSGSLNVIPGVLDLSFGCLKSGDILRVPWMFSRW